MRQSKGVNLNTHAHFMLCYRHISCYVSHCTEVSLADGVLQIRYFARRIPKPGYILIVWFDPDNVYFNPYHEGIMLEYTF